MGSLGWLGCLAGSGWAIWASCAGWAGCAGYAKMCLLVPLDLPLNWLAGFVGFIL